MVDKSAGGRPSEVEEEMSHDSKAEKRIEVDVPPRILPRRRMGKEGMEMQRQARM